MRREREEVVLNFDGMKITGWGYTPQFTLGQPKAPTDIEVTVMG